jgi:hypothetical protein
MAICKIQYSDLPFYYNPNEWVKSPKIILKEYAQLQNVHKLEFFCKIGGHQSPATVINTGTLCTQFYVSVVYGDMICFLDKIFNTITLGEHNASILVLLVLFGACSSAQELQYLISKKIRFLHKKQLMLHPLASSVSLGMVHPLAAPTGASVPLELMHSVQTSQPIPNQGLQYATCCANTRRERTDTNPQKYFERPTEPVFPALKKSNNYSRKLLVPSKNNCRPESGEHDLSRFSRNEKRKNYGYKFQESDHPDKSIGFSESSILSPTPIKDDGFSEFIVDEKEQICYKSQRFTIEKTKHLTTISEIGEDILYGEKFLEHTP